MKDIDLKKIIEVKGYGKREIAELLFPQNSIPVRALDRVLNKVSHLDARQISRFSLYSGIPICELFSGGSWKSSNQDGTHVLETVGYRAEINPDSLAVKIFKKDSLF